MSSVRVGSLEIAYHELGAGEPVLLINGTGESGDTWLPVIEPLSDRYRFVAIDQRDTGASSSTSEAYTPADLAADAIGVIEALGCGPVHVAGFSLGGAVAQELAIAKPDLVRSLVLISTWARSDAWFVSQMRSWQVLRRAHAHDEEAFLRALDPWMFSPTTFDTEAYERIHAMWREAPDQEPDAFIRQCEADIAHDAASRLPTVRAPAVVVVGSDDICTPPRCARELYELLPSATLIEITAAGHCVPFERPDEVRATLREFLDRV